VCSSLHGPSGHEGPCARAATVLKPEPPVQRCPWEKPGDVIHVETKQLPCLSGLANAAPATAVKAVRRALASRMSIWRWMTELVWPTWRLPPDEQKATTDGFLARVVGWFSDQGITCRRVLSYNGSGYPSGDWRMASRSLGIDVQSYGYGHLILSHSIPSQVPRSCIKACDDLVLSIH
jgi:hypothetical protein